MFRQYASIPLAVFTCLIIGAGCSQTASNTPTAADSKQAAATPPPVAAVTSPSPSAASFQDKDEPRAAAEDAVPAAAPTPRKRIPEELPKPVALTPEDWPQYRGANRDGISQATGLAHKLPAEGPKVIWQTAVGQGYSAPSIVAGNVYLDDYDEKQDEWMVRCLSLADGQEHWRYKVKKNIRPNHGITRSAPAADGGYVISIDPKCEVHCLDARNGELLWKKFLPSDYGTQIPPWYNGQCPLIEGDRVVIATGGRAVMTALKKESGEKIWETENKDSFLLSHSSIVPTEIDGVKQYAYTTLKGALGVDAQTGKQLWFFPWKFNTAVCSMPLPLGSSKFLLTAGYHAQTVVCQVTHSGNEWTAKEVVSLPPPTAGWNSEVHTPIFYKDRVFGIGKKQRGLWTCLDQQGKELWTSEHHASFELGGYVLADGMFIVVEGTTGMVRMLDANADHYEELGSFQLLTGPDAWAPPVISHGRLLVRDMAKLICVDISADAAKNAGSKTAAASPAAK